MLYRILSLLLLSWALPVHADPLTADEIMQRVYDRDDGDDATANVQMTLIDRNGDRRERTLRSFAKDFGPDTKQMLFFLSPPDVQDIGLLTFDYAGVSKDDDQWLYLPALKKTKRIASSDQSGKFLGTDFSYADLTERENDQYSYDLLGREEVRGQPAWKIRATPKPQEIERTGYLKSVIWVQEESFVVVRAVHWVREGRKMKYYDVSRLEQIQGIWSPLEVTMTTKTKDQRIEHRTILRVSDLHYDQPFDPGRFSVRELEKGP